jgi:hypothetical protein
MNGGTKSGVSTISFGRLQCARGDSAAPQKEEEEEPQNCFQFLLHFTHHLKFLTCIQITNLGVGGARTHSVFLQTCSVCNLVRTETNVKCD